MKSKIIATHIALPEFSEPTEKILEYAREWVKDQDKRTQEKILRLFTSAQVDKRYSIMPIQQVFTVQSFEDRNNYFIEKTIDLAQKALEGALHNANLSPDQIDMIITTSCTGIMIPSVDAYLVNRLKMKQNIVRLPVTEMGCAGGTSALIYAHQVAEAYPHKRIAVIAVESPTSTFQLEDFTMTNAVSAAIFGDGCACAILGPSDEVHPVIKDTQMYHFYNEPHMMGFALKNSGLHIILDPEVPNKIEQHFERIMLPFLTRNNLHYKDIEHFIFHPGGKKIIQVVEDLLHAIGKNIDITRDVLKSYGNMSSATVLYVLDRYMEKNIQSGEKGMMLSFGPGFTAQTLLLEWN